MMEWAGPQWVLATLLLLATLINLGGAVLQKGWGPARVGWLSVRLGNRACLVAILVWGGFF